MKVYCKPKLEYINVTAEERFANGSKCVPYGYCGKPDPDHPGQTIHPYNL